ncbi:MAG: hypothetical protein V4619_18050 [Bacteroidota bacterium]
MPKYHQTSDLAKYVHVSLKDLKNIKGFAIQDVLKELFDCLYFSSMQSEEGDLIQVTVTFIDINIPSDDEKYDHWTYTPFADPIKLTIKNLVKISKAADPWSTSIAVYYDEDEGLQIYGLIDQAIHNQSFVNHENEAKPEQAGFFQASIQGIGIISVTSDYKLIAILKQNLLIRNFLDVWRLGQIAELIEEKAQSSIKNVKLFIGKNFPEEAGETELDDYEYQVLQIWRNTISRILIQIRKYHHGGAILITNTTENLDIKYRIVYKRLRLAMLRYIKTTIILEIYNSRIGKAKDVIDKELYDNKLAFEFKRKEASNQLKGAIRFIASQSCVDGLIVVNNDFQTLGFGAVIEKVAPPMTVYQSLGARYNIATLIEKDPKDFGTRHRSMMTFCSQNPGSIGIVISQDNDIRVMSQFNERLIMWDNVRTQKLYKPFIIPSIPEIEDL